MAWLQKRPQINQSSLFYTIGLHKTILIVGLGNPGDKYTNTRHNIGFMCVDEFTKSQTEFTGWIAKKDLKCLLNTAQLQDKRVIAMKPTTYMNDSGEALAAVIDYFKIDPASILVIHDELDINFGQLRTRVGGKDAGHNGIKSIATHLKSEDFGRLRIGTGPKKPPEVDSKDFVLKAFSKEEMAQLPNLYKEVSAVLTEYIYSDSSLPADTRTFIV